MLELMDYYGPILLAPFILLNLLSPAPAGSRLAWRLRALGISALAFATSFLVALGLVQLLPASALIDGSALGTVGGAIVGVLLYELAHYAYHRAAHAFDGLWRAGHQLHHSAEHFDAFGAYFLHPIDVACFTLCSVFVFGPVLGLAPESVAIAFAFLAFNAAFQHADLRTPRWLGYLVQRPESHRVHHARGHHRSNYSDLPLWDIVFGTFENPAADAVPERFGFEPGDSARLVEMLACQDITKVAAADAHLHRT